jgi:FkbM family methyltransferase
MSIRTSFVQLLDSRFPTILSQLRYRYHVLWKGDIVYPQVTRPIFQRLNSADKVAFDVGANVGIFARYLSDHFSNVVAVEPITYLCDHLRKSLPSNCRVESVALGASEGEIVLRIPVDVSGREMPALTTAAHGNSLQFVPNAGVVERTVPVKKLDHLVSDNMQLAFVKIDVEGFENEVLAGAHNTLLKHRPVFQIEISRAHNPNYESTLARLRDLDYRSFSIQKNGLHSEVEQFIEATATNFTKHEASCPKGFWDYLFVPVENVPSLLEGLIRS